MIQVSELSRLNEVAKELSKLKIKEVYLIGSFYISALIHILKTNYSVKDNKLEKWLNNREETKDVDLVIKSDLEGLLLNKKNIEKESDIYSMFKNGKIEETTKVYRINKGNYIIELFIAPKKFGLGNIGYFEIEGVKFYLISPKFVIRGKRGRNSKKDQRDIEILEYIMQKYGKYFKKDQKYKVIFGKN